jgi:hypothetical protein
MPWYDTDDRTTRIGQMIGDAFTAVFAAYMIWGLFFN